MRKTMLIIVVLLLLVACAAPKPDPNGAEIDSSDVWVWHDDKRHVTCWIYSSYYKGGISCIPDWQLTPPDGR